MLHIKPFLIVLPKTFQKVGLGGGFITPHSLKDRFKAPHHKSLSVKAQILECVAKICIPKLADILRFRPKIYQYQYQISGFLLFLFYLFLYSEDL